MQDELILVDSNDRAVGIMEKLRAHQEGKLHRAISVFVFHPDGRLMLQQRAISKYHCAGLWSNTCCSHPRPHESVKGAAVRRLREEMGMMCELREVHSFIYRTEFDNGLVEHEYDHVLVGVSDQEPIPNPEEVQAWKWVEPQELLDDMRLAPDAYTYWLRVMLTDVLRLR